MGRRFSRKELERIQFRGLRISIIDHLISKFINRKDMRTKWKSSFINNYTYLSKTIYLSKSWEKESMKFIHLINKKCNKKNRNLKQLKKIFFISQKKIFLQKFLLYQNNKSQQN